MRIITWNTRGLNAPSKQRVLKCNLTLFESDIIMIQENKLNKEEGDKLRKRLGRWNAEMKESDGASSGIGIIWNTRTKNIKTIISNSN